MDLLTVIVGVFCFFLFQWLFRGIFFFVCLKVVSRIVEQIGKKLEEKKGELYDAMSDMRRDGK